MQLTKIQLGSYIIVAVFLFFCCKLWQLQVIEGDKYRALSESNRLRIVKTPAPRGIIFDRNGTALVKDVPFFSVSISPESLKGLDLDALATFLGVEKSEIEEKLNRKDNSPFIPLKIKEGLSFPEIAHVEAGKSDFPGLFVETEVGREYLFGKVGAHIIGYLGKLTPAQFENPSFRNFPPDALIGQWGVEGVLDKELRGTPGERIIEVDALGRELRLIQQRPAVRGQDITLSIDIDIQKAVEDEFKDKAGALVAIAPDTGEILAMESLPSFDPNVFSRGIQSKDWKELVEDKKDPMLNRALQSQYPPGSTFKIITATAALEEGVIELDQKINCTGGIHYGKWTFGCWKKHGHGPIDFHRAIVESCDTYFYEVGRRLGIDKIYKYATAFGLGKETGLNLMIKERRGLIPNTEWKRQMKRMPWYLGETYNAAIGQGYVAATPIQMARMMATFSNGGTLYPLSLIKGGSKPIGQLGIKPETIQTIKDALAGVVNEPGGTGHAAQSQAVLIAGKTGTAQVVGKRRGVSAEKFLDHAWFVGFAPVDKPKIAVAVFVEHGVHGGTAAAPIARRAIEAYLIKHKPAKAVAPPTVPAGDNPDVQEKTQDSPEVGE